MHGSLPVEEEEEDSEDEGEAANLLPTARASMAAAAARRNNPFGMGGPAMSEIHGNQPAPSWEPQAWTLASAFGAGAQAQPAAQAAWAHQEAFGARTAVPPQHPPYDQPGFGFGQHYQAASSSPGQPIPNQDPSAQPGQQVPPQPQTWSPQMPTGVGLGPAVIGAQAEGSFLQDLWGQPAQQPLQRPSDLEFQMEILKTLKALQRGRQGEYNEDEEDWTPGAEIGLGLSEFGASGPGQHRKLEGVRRQRRMWLARPNVLTRAYVLLARERLGIIEANTPFHMCHYATLVKPQFGKCLGLYRVFHALMEVLDLLAVRGRVQHATALLVQLAKAVHQAAMDGGSWVTGALLLPTEDPLTPPRFAGTASELAGVASYREGMQALRLGVALPGSQAFSSAGGAAGSHAAPAAAGAQDPSAGDAAQPTNPNPQKKPKPRRKKEEA